MEEVLLLRNDPESFNKLIDASLTEDNHSSLKDGVTTTTTQQSRHHDVRIKHVVISPDIFSNPIFLQDRSKVRRLWVSINSHSTITHFHVQRRYDIAWFSLSSWLLKIENILPSLKSLKIEDPVRLPRDHQEMKLLTSLIDKARCLEEVHLTNIHTSTIKERDPRENALVIEAFLSLENLKSFCLGGPMSPRNTFQHGLFALDKILRRVCRSNRLRHLGLQRLGLRDSDLMLLATELTNNTSLETIDLRQNKPAKSCAGYHALLSALQNQMHVKRLLLEDSPLHDAEYTKVCIFTEDQSSAKAIATKIYSFTHMNELGRRRILSVAASLGEWVDLIIAVRNDPNALYSLLQSEPTLCHRV